MCKKFKDLNEYEKFLRIYNNSYFKAELDKKKITALEPEIVYNQIRHLMKYVKDKPKKSQYTYMTAPFIISPLENSDESMKKIFEINGQAKGRDLYEYWRTLYGVNQSDSMIMDIKEKFSKRKIISGKEKRKTSFLCKEYWIQRGYSEEETKQKISEVQTINANKRDKRNYKDLSNYPNRKEYWMKRGYNEDQSIELSNQKIKEQGNDLEGFVFRHGEKTGKELYYKRIEKYKNSMRDEDGAWKAPSRTSKESLKFFIPIYKFLRKNGIKENDIKWGISNNKEYFLNYKGSDIYRYDFTIVSLGVIVEYHGLFWHPPCIEQNDNIRSFYKGDYFREKYFIDRHKEQVARDKGFEIYPIWSIENDKHHKVLNFLKDKLNERKII